MHVALRTALFVLALSLPAVGHNDERTAYAIPLDGITLDGRLDDWPERMAVYPIAWVSPRYYKSEPPEGPADLTASFRVGYDAGENLLYVAVVARDDDWVIDPEEGSFNNQDLCEIYVDADHSGGMANLFAGAQDAQQYVLVAGPSRFSFYADGNPALNRGDTRSSGLKRSMPAPGRVHRIRVGDSALVVLSRSALFDRTRCYHRLRCRGYRYRWRRGRQLGSLDARVG